jgi:hypothetical protein
MKDRCQVITKAHMDFGHVNNQSLLCHPYAECLGTEAASTVSVNRTTLGTNIFF